MSYGACRTLPPAVFLVPVAPFLFNLVWVSLPRNRCFSFVLCEVKVIAKLVKGSRAIGFNGSNLLSSVMRGLLYGKTWRRH